MSARMLGILNARKGSPFSFYVPLLIAMIFFTGGLNAQRNDGQFVVVLDAGHGGHDPGNLGNGYLEKNIALNIVLNAGAILERTPGVKVIYTRKDDTFVDLYVRGEIANKANADLFVSVHCDSHTSSAHGAGTFVLGLHANKQNFEIAKKENSVIYLEDNYESRYADYDINSPESVIGLTIMQEEFLDQSIALAKGIQSNFANKLKRKDREVKQAGFIVLHQTFMPSVLVETGFLTNDDEGAYLNSKGGQSDMGSAIAQAILVYKDGVSVPQETSNVTMRPAPGPKEEKAIAKEIVESDKQEKTQNAEQEFAKNPGANPVGEKTVVAVSEKFKAEEATTDEEISDSAEKKETITTRDAENANTAIAEDVVQEASSDTESAVEQEVVLASTEPEPSEPMKKETPKLVSVEKEVPSTTVVSPAHTKGNDKNIVFKVQLMASTKEIALQASNFGGLNKLSKERFKQFNRYMYGNTDSFEQAKLLKSNADVKGYPGSYIVAYKDGIRIPTPEAIKLVSEY